MGELYKLKESDRQIFDVADEHPNVFTEWYFRTPYSGTHWHPHSPRKLISDGYDKMRAEWEALGCPMRFKSNVDDVLVRFENGEPVFHQLHGFRFQDGWQMDFAKSEKMTDVLLGGMGSGKTLIAMVRSMKQAIRLGGYKGFLIGPQMKQAAELWDKAIKMMFKTRFGDQFFRTKTSKPPTFTLGHSEIGEITYTCIPALDDPDAIKNLEGDEIIIDQFEMLGIDNDFKANVVSRLRGYDPMTGREKWGKLTYLGNANSDDPGFLELVEEAKSDPENFGFFQPDTRDNLYISDRQLARMKREFIKTEEDEDVYFRGIPSLGKGKYFPITSIGRCKSSTLTEEMLQALREKRPGWVMEEARGVGVYKFEMPPIQGHTYITLADPGWGNPPGRNAPAIGVLDITHFPTTPATLTAFSWTFGKGHPEPWINQFLSYTRVYNTIGRSYYDATGPQRGYERFVKDLMHLGAVPVGLQSGEKDANLTGLRTLLSQGLIQWSDKIGGIPNQLLKYELPDTHLAQDIVIMLALSSIHLSPLLLQEDRKPREEHARPRDRYARPHRRTVRRNRR